MICTSYIEVANEQFLSMNNDQQQEIIRNYINAYNNFDVPGMLAHLHEDIEFKSVSNGEVNMILNGVEAFGLQAEQATHFFSQRHQEIISRVHDADQVDVAIRYQATLAIDLPNGMKKGEELSMKGKSIFRFFEGKIFSLTDIS